MNNFSAWAEWAGRASAATLLALVLGTGYLGVWVWGTEFKSMVAERDEWKGEALKALHAGEKIHAVRRAPGTASAVGRGPADLDEVKARVRRLEGN